MPGIAVLWFYVLAVSSGNSFLLRTDTILQPQLHIAHPWKVYSLTLSTIVLSYNSKSGTGSGQKRGLDVNILSRFEKAEGTNADGKEKGEDDEEVRIYLNFIYFVNFILVVCDSVILLCYFHIICKKCEPYVSRLSAALPTSQLNLPVCFLFSSSHFLITQSLNHSITLLFFLYRVKQKKAPKRWKSSGTTTITLITMLRTTTTEMMTSVAAMMARPLSNDRLCVYLNTKYFSVMLFFVWDWRVVAWENAVQTVVFEKKKKSYFHEIFLPLQKYFSLKAMLETS